MRKLAYKSLQNSNTTDFRWNRAGAMPGPYARYGFLMNETSSSAGSTPLSTPRASSCKPRTLASAPNTARMAIGATEDAVRTVPQTKVAQVTQGAALVRLGSPGG